MNTIFKYKLNHGTNEIDMPDGAVILTAQIQYGEVCIWARCQTENPNVRRKFQFYGTGHSIPLNASKYIGTVQEMLGKLVWHVFEIV